MRRAAAAVLIVIVLWVAAVVRQSSLQIGFLSEDFAIVEAVHRQGAWEWLQLNLTGRYLHWIQDFYRPVTAGVFTAEVALFGTSPVPYHVVALAFLLGAGFLFWRCARRLLPERPEVAGALVLAWLCLPVHTEPSCWTVAGVQDIVAAFFAALTVLLLLRTSLWSLLTALLAYGTMESAFGMAPFLPVLALGLERDDRARRRLLLAFLHLALGAVAFLSRGLVLPHVTIPYAAGGAGELVTRTLSAARDYPGALVAAIGVSGTALLCVLWLVGLITALRRNADLPPMPCARLRRALFPPLALLAFSAPLFTLPLATIAPAANARVFVPASLGAFVALLPGLARLRPRPLVVTFLLLAAGGAALETGGVPNTFVKMSREAADARQAVAAVPGERLLVAGLPGSLQWAYPAASRPPFRAEARDVFPLRVGTTRDRDVTPLRPLEAGTRVVIMQGWQAQLVTEQPAVAPSDAPPLSFRALADGALELKDAGLPMRLLPSLLVHPSAQVDPAQAFVLVEIRTDDGGRTTRRLPYVPVHPGPVVVPLLDLPAWPEAILERLVVSGATRAARGPGFPGRIHVSDPPPGTLLTLADAARPFVLEGLPPGTRALRVTLLTAGGAGLPLVVPDRAFTFLRLVEDRHFAYVLDAGLRLASDTVFLAIEALSDPENPGSLLARAPLARYRIRLR